jgi:hypothetical protein
MVVLVANTKGMTFFDKHYHLNIYLPRSNRHGHKRPYTAKLRLKIRLSVMIDPGRLPSSYTEAVYGFRLSPYTVTEIYDRLRPYTEFVTVDLGGEK